MTSLERRTHYPQVEANPDFPKIEESVLKHWKKEGLFQRSIDNRPANLPLPLAESRGEGSNEFIFYDGPPFANGDVQRGIYLLTRDTLDKASLIHSRKLTPRLEDPATGSAAGCAAAYLAKHGLAKSGATVKMEQGHIMGRPSELLLSAVRKTDGTVDEVKVGGSSVLVLEGSVSRLA